MDSKITIAQTEALPLHSQGKFTREALLIFSTLNPTLRAELDDKGNLILMPPSSTRSGLNSGKFYGEL